MAGLCLDLISVVAIFWGIPRLVLQVDADYCSNKTRRAVEPCPHTPTRKLRDLAHGTTYKAKIHPGSADIGTSYDVI